MGILADLVWCVVIENKKDPNAYITKPMHQSFMEGNFDMVPILIGYTSEEILSFISSKVFSKISFLSLVTNRFLFY